MKMTAAQRERFEKKYGVDLLTQIISAIKGKELVIGESRNITVDEERYEEPNVEGKKGKAYAYLDGFTKELVIDFIEYENKKDKLGYNELKLAGFKEYKVSY